MKNHTTSRATPATISTYIPSAEVLDALLSSGCEAYLEESDAWTLASGASVDVSGTVAVVTVETFAPDLMLRVWTAENADSLVAVLSDVRK